MKLVKDWAQRVCQLSFMTVAVLTITACGASAPVKTVAATCDLPTDKRVEEAFAQARATLSKEQCVYRYDEVFSSLRKVAKGNPGMENQRRFANFFQWLTNQGILSKNQGKKAFTAYFSPKFVALSGDYSVCHYAMTAKEHLVQSVQKELVQKQEGLLHIMKDSGGFVKAQRVSQGLELMLDASERACQG